MPTDLLSRLGISVPIIQAPMGGSNATPPSLIAAVSNAGGLGFLGAAYMSPDQITRECSAIREPTKRPFGINLFVPVLEEAPRDTSRARACIATLHDELGLPAPAEPALPSFTFDQQLDAVLASDAPIFSYTFGMLPGGGAMERLKRRGMFVIGTATTVDEAIALERAGVDAIAAQGSEAGAHRGSFLRSFESSMVGTMALVPQIVSAVHVPVIAAGGIMDGRGIAAALRLGASAAALGTAFLVTDECGVAESYKQAVLSARDDQTKLTRAFSGRPARGIPNRAMTYIEAADAVLPYPYQNSLTRAMRTEAAKQDRAEYLSLWAGQGAKLARRMPASRLMERLIAELHAAMAA